MGSTDSTDYAIGPPPPDGNQNRGGQIIAVDSVIFGISWSMILLRTVTRSWITRNFGWDDAIILLAGFTNAVGLGFYVAMVLYGLGRHKYYLSHYDYKEFLKYDYLDWIQAFITLAVSKISICLFLLRLSKFNKLKRVLWGLIGFVVVTHLPLTILMIAQCDPVSRAWNTALTGKCFSKQMVKDVLIAQGVLSILTDFIGAAFPVVLLWNVKIHLHDKVALWLLMGFGVITGVACIVRTSLTYQIMKPDLSWVSVGLASAKMLEVNFGIIAACLPLMKPLYTFMRSGKTPRRSSSIPKPTSTGSYAPWWKFRPSRTFVATNHSPSQPKLTKGFDTDSKRQWTWRPNVLNLPSSVVKKDENHGTQDTNTSISPPLHGIQRTTESRFDGRKDTKDKGIELEEFV